LKRNENRLHKLLSLAEKEDVIVEFLDVEQTIAWNGLYVSTGLGSAIGISSTLTLENKVWVLAHELGHHFSGIERVLFSPFKYDVPGFNNPKEEQNADFKGLQLIDEEMNWREIELNHPTDLYRLSQEMELPSDAAISRIQYLNSIYANHFADCEFSAEMWENIHDRSKGDGGTQITIKKFLKRKLNSKTKITFKEFNQLRARAVKFKGGFGKITRQILEELTPQIKQVGGIFSFFGINAT
jgi:Zn-dependent peptidase ImmA (M78 family)